MRMDSTCIRRNLVYVPEERIYFVYEIIKNRAGNNIFPEGMSSDTIEGALENFFNYREETQCAYDSAWTFWDITGLELEDIKKKVLVEKLMK
jgi:hypothetical protein